MTWAKHFVDKVRQKGFLGDKVTFSCRLAVESKKEEKRENSSFSLRFTEFHRSEFVEPRVKVHLLDEGYVLVLKMRDFTENPKEEISGNQIFGIRRCS